MTISQGNRHIVYALGGNSAQTTMPHSFINNQLCGSCKKTWLCPRVEKGLLEAHLYVACIFFFKYFFRCTLYVKPSQTSHTPLLNHPQSPLLATNKRELKKCDWEIHGACWVPHIHGFTSSLLVLAWALLQESMETVLVGQSVDKTEINDLKI